MSTLEDFKNAPVGATATHDDGLRAMKTDNVGWTWVTPNGVHASDKQMAYWGYTLDPEAPATAREALDLAWELAHPVKEGQVIPKGTQYLGTTGSGVKEYTAPFDIKIGFHSEPERRTLEPLPDPEPDWLNAPAVLARLDSWGDDERVVFVPASTDNRWVTGTGATFHWNELRDVTPLS